jgi:hypothetical protein
VLASNICTHTQYISDWGNGRIFDYSATSLAKTIVELWARRTELPAMKRRAEESGEQYLWEHTEPAFLAAIDGIAARKA